VRKKAKVGYPMSNLYTRAVIEIDMAWGSWELRMA